MCPCRPIQHCTRAKTPGSGERFQFALREQGHTVSGVKRSTAAQPEARRSRPERRHRHWGGERAMLIEMSIKGLMVDPITNMPIVILKDKLGERVLSIWVGIFEANAIALQIENVSTPRPMTHDLLRNII